MSSVESNLLKWLGTHTLLVRVKWFNFKGPLNTENNFTETDPLTCTMVISIIFTTILTPSRPIGPKNACCSYKHDKFHELWRHTINNLDPDSGHDVTDSGTLLWRHIHPFALVSRHRSVPAVCDVTINIIDSRFLENCLGYYIFSWNYFVGKVPKQVLRPASWLLHNTVLKRWWATHYRSSQWNKLCGCWW